MSKYEIIYIEDGVWWREKIQKELAKHGVLVHNGYPAGIAIRKLNDDKNEKIRAVLIDYILPHRDTGLACEEESLHTRKQIKKIRPHIPVWCITGYPMRNEAKSDGYEATLRTDEVRSHAFDDYFYKCLKPNKEYFKKMAEKIKRLLQEISFDYDKYIISYDKSNNKVSLMERSKNRYKFKKNLTIPRRAQIEIIKELASKTDEKFKIPSAIMEPADVLEPIRLDHNDIWRCRWEGCRNKNKPMYFQEIQYLEEDQIKKLRRANVRLMTALRQTLQKEAGFPGDCIEGVPETSEGTKFFYAGYEFKFRVIPESMIDDNL